MMETCMVIYLGCFCYKSLYGEIYSRNLYRNRQTESGSIVSAVLSPADFVQPLCAAFFLMLLQWK